MMAQYASILFSMILVNNYVLVRFLGVSKKFDSAVGMGAAVTLVMVIAIAVTWPIQQLLDAWGLGYLQTIAFILVIATVYSCYSSYMSSVYMVEKKSALNLYTTMAGAALNLVLNALLIPAFGVNGATVATFLSYLLVFVLRVLSSRRYIPFDIHPRRMVFNTVLLFAQAAILLLGPAWWIPGCGAIFVLLAAVNFRELLQLAEKLLRRRKKA